MIDPLDKLFAFPVVMIDMDNEEQRKKLALPGDDDADIIVGEIECPYYDFNGIGDRWLPTEESLQKARDGKFDACSVTFLNVGTLLVPWTKSKFKKEFRKFVESLNLEPERNVTFLLTTDKESIKGLNEGDESKPE